MNPSPQIVLAKTEDADVLSEVIAQAFHLLAPSIWLIPIAPARREIFPDYFRLFVDDAMARGTVYTTPERTAAALWLSVPETGLPTPAGYDEALALATRGWVDRFRQFDALLEKHHPAGRHDHLAILAVHPDHQRRGLGTALLDTHHRRLDQAHQPTATYLEASDANTRELYLQHGYTDHGVPIPLPDGPQMFPMVRLSADAGARESS